jgi:myo-inositol-1(or 4)-monophosphatase
MLPILMINTKDLDRVRRLVRTAALEELMSRFESVSAEFKTDGSLITSADLAMQHRLQTELARQWPQYVLLGEEMDAAEQESLLASPGAGLWCLDPLDGTGNFAAGIPFFAVSLALICDGAVQAAVVYDPCRDECFSALRGQGAWLNGSPLIAASTPERLRDAMAMVDLKRLPEPLIRAVAKKAPYRSQRSFGSVALDWCWIAGGRCQVYLHGGQKLWDYAAGQLVMSESGAAGGLLGDYDGDWLTEFSLSPRIAVAATHADLLQQWRTWITQGLEV